MKKGVKVLLWIAGVLLVLAFGLATGAWMLFGDIVTAANSIEKLEDGLYAMEFEGDYGFDEFMSRGGAESDDAVAAYLIEFLSKGFYKNETSIETGEFGCSTICTTSEKGQVLFGRNYDWAECSAMIVHTKPENGYESFSTCCLDFLGFDAGYQPDASMIEKMMSLAAIYVPLDGMNEKGLMIADLMAGDDEATHQDTSKPDLTTTTAIRLLLDRAADVDEAIALLKEYDMNSSMGAAHHLSIADKSGKSVVVEYVNGEMLVTETKVVTNHYLSACEKQGFGSAQSHQRYEMLMNCPIPKEETDVRDILESVAQKNYPQTDGYYEKTMWSIVYCPEGLCADFYFKENYDRQYGLMLLDKGGFLFRPAR